MHRAVPVAVALTAVLAASCVDHDTAEPWQIEERCPGGPFCEAPEPLSACGGQLPPRSTLTPDEGDTVTHSLALDPSGCPHISYFQDGALKYARWDGERWQVEPIAPVDASDSVHAIAIDGDGQVTVAYARRDPPRLYVAARQGVGDWQVDPVADMNVWTLMHDVGPDGRRRIVVTRSDDDFSLQNPVVLALTDRGADWRSERVLSGIRNVTYLPGQIAYDSASRMHLGLAGGGSSQALVHARSSAAGWRTEQVIDERGAAYAAAIAVDAGDRPHLLSCSSSQSSLVEHVWHDRDQWRRETIEPCDQGTCWCGAAAMDDHDRLHVLYGQAGDAGGVDLVHGIWDGQAWQLRELGLFDRSDLALRVDPRTGGVHVLATRHREEGRAPVYQHLEAER